MHGAEKLPAPMLRRLRRSMIAVRCFSLPAGGPMPAFAPLRTERRTNDFCATTAPSLAGSHGSHVTQRQRLPEALRAVAGANTMLATRLRARRKYFRFPFVRSSAGKDETDMSPWDSA